MEETRSWLDAQTPLHRNVGIVEKLLAGSLGNGITGKPEVSSPQDSALLLCALPVVPRLSECHLFLSEGTIDFFFFSDRHCTTSC